MTTSIISSLTFAGQQITIYFGIPALIAGILGGFLLTIVFLSLQTFRQSSCAFYLTIMSIVNIGQLITGLLSRIMIDGFFIDWTQTSLFYCKFRLFFATACAQMSYTCLCLAIIDQYFATCSRPRWQQWSNIKIARRLTVLFIIIWVLYGIPYVIFFSQIYSISTNTVSCSATSTIFTNYRVYFNAPVIVGLLPLCIMSSFGIMVYRNLQSMAYRTVPLVRRELDKQLTTIVLVQIPIHIISISPYTVMNVLTANPNVTNDPITWAKLQFAAAIAFLLFYIDYLTPFYVCVCISERFRRQLRFVLRKTFCIRCIKSTTVAANQIAPEP